MGGDRLGFTPLKLTIRRKFSIVFVLLILLPALVLGLLTLRVVRNALVEQAESEQLLLLRSLKSDVVDRHIEDMERALRALAQEPELPNVFDDQESREEVISQWELSRKLFPERSWIYFGTPDNQILVSPTWIPPEGYDCRVRPWYTAARYANGIVWIEPYTEYVTYETVTSAATAVYDDTGTFRGVLSVDTHLQSFFAQLRRNADSKSPQILAVSSNGDTLMLNQKERDLQEMAHLPKWKQLKSVSDSGRYLHYDGRSYYAVFADVPKLGLKLVSLLPSKALYQDLAPVAWTIFSVSTSFLGVAILAGLYFAKHFIGNIERLNEYVSSVESGDYRIRYCVSGRDELYELNSRLNTMVHRLSENIESLERESNTDPLCGIANRRYIIEQLAEHVNAAAQHHRELSVALFDVDHFKDINDTFGHIVGDEVLRRIASIMTDALPHGSIVGRYGGEEFVAILPGFTSVEAFKLADGFRARLQDQAWRERNLVVTISGGVSGWSADSNSSDLMGRADEALYRAKRGGRNRVVRLN